MAFEALKKTSSFENGTISSSISITVGGSVLFFKIAFRLSYLFHVIELSFPISKWPHLFQSDNFSLSQSNFSPDDWGIFRDIFPYIKFFEFSPKSSNLEFLFYFFFFKFCHFWCKYFLKRRMSKFSYPFYRIEKYLMVHEILVHKVGQTLELQVKSLVK